MQPNIIKAAPEHIDCVAGRLRLPDTADLWATAGISSTDAVRYSLHVSVHSWAWNVEGEVACLFGLVAPSLISHCAMPWVITTPLVERHPIEFMRGSRRMLAHMLQLFPTLEGYVDARHDVSIRWLRWLGFRIHAAEIMEPYHLLFHRFEME